jgi:hypothetical protein
MIPVRTTVSGLRLSVVAIGACVLGLAGLPSAAAGTTLKKSIWGPTAVSGVSQFPIYAQLGAGIFQTSLAWSDVAPTKPAQGRDPADPAYRWPSDVDFAIREGRKYGIRVSILLTGTPGWANGGRESRFAPFRPRDFATFAAAASRRYPAVRHWMIWGEPSKASRFQPIRKSAGRRMSRAQKKGPRLYARLLDASYSALKRVNRRNLVIGGNTWTGGDVTPLNFIRAMRLPSGRRPRMDLYGHNPFTARLPDLGSDPLRYGFADFSDLDTLTGWLDRYGYRTAKNRKLRLFLSELVIPTGHKNVEFNFWVDRSTQARWLRAALKITRRSRRIYTLGYLGLYDDPPRPDGLEVNRGLIDRRGRKKPAYFAYRAG